MASRCSSGMHFASGRLMTGAIVLLVLASIFKAEALPAGRAANSTVAKTYFKIFCKVHHRLNDDPILFPGQPGRSHSHDYFGSTIVNAYTRRTSDLLKGNTSCIPAGAKNGYWLPTLHRLKRKTGEYIPEAPRVITVYYFNKYHGDLSKTTRPHPNGLRMICGNATAKSPSEVPVTVVEWFCSETAFLRNRTRYSNFPRRCTGLIMARVYCPSCWDGRNLDSPDHRSHMAYVNHVTTECPSSHPVRLPGIHVTLTYNFSSAGTWPQNGIRNTTTKPLVKLSTVDGAGWQLHLDVWEAWEPNTIKNFIDKCWNPGLRCGPDAKDDTKPPIP